MGKKPLFFFVLWIHSLMGFSTHLVGGEFEIIHIEGNRYLFRQIQYFDQLTGDPGARDPEVNASIFRKSDHVYMRNIRMVLVEESRVEYSNPSCDDARVVTRRQVYEAVETLDPAEYADPEGYYMVWERCCRNITVTNVRTPEETGQTYYIEFPALMKNGERFINSSPQLFPPLSDYACVNRFYHADFGGFDADGDSLVYSLTAPLNSSTFAALPRPTRAPHPKVTWQPGFSDEVQIPGNQPLAVSNDGLLTVTPSEQGLFVFSVKVEEYRDGEKIGELRRDFQLLVVDCPPPGHVPEIKVKPPGAGAYTRFPPTIDVQYGDDACFDIMVTDQDGGEEISVKIIPVNFQDEYVLSDQMGVIENPEDTFKFNFCFPSCINNGAFNPAIIDVVVFDNQCPQSLIDTLRIRANILQPPNDDPALEFPVGVEEVVVQEGSGTLTLPFKGVDADGDSLSMRLVPVDFSFDDYGVVIDTMINELGEIEYVLSWNTDCTAFPIGLKNEFEIMVLLDDFDECLKSNTDTAFYHVTIELPPNTPPVISIGGVSDTLEVNVRIDERVDFSINASDPDGDEVSIVALPVNFDMEAKGLSFEEVVGSGSVSQVFDWHVSCAVMDSVPLPDTLVVRFIARDHDKCLSAKSDTVTLIVYLFPPLNEPPVISIDEAVAGTTLNAQVWDDIALKINAVDPNQDSVYLELLSADSLFNTLGVAFSTQQGQSAAQGDFGWFPDCEHLARRFQEATYTFTLRATDNKCYVSASSEHTFTLVLRDKEVDYNFFMPNAFTPNETDEINQYYYIPNIPPDNCANRFEEIVIFNRWGKTVYRSDDREFKWDGGNHSVGVYYFALLYTEKTFRGIINLLK